MTPVKPVFIVLFCVIYFVCNTVTSTVVSCKQPIGTVVHLPLPAPKSGDANVCMRYELTVTTARVITVTNSQNQDYQMTLSVARV